MIVEAFNMKEKEYMVAENEKYYSRTAKGKKIITR